MGIISSLAGPMEIASLVVEPLDDQFVQAQFLLMVTVTITYTEDGTVLQTEVPVYFSDNAVLCITDPERLSVNVTGTTNSLAVGLNDDTYLLSVESCIVYTVTDLVDLLVPSLGFCVPRPCNSESTGDQIVPPSRIECIQVTMVYDSCSSLTNREVIKEYPLSQI